MDILRKTDGLELIPSGVCDTGCCYWMDVSTHPLYWVLRLAAEVSFRSLWITVTGERMVLFYSRLDFVFW